VPSLNILSRISRAALRGVEVGWLIAVAVVPVLNPLGLVFDEPRLALFRALVLVMLAMHLIARLQSNSHTSLLASVGRGANVFLRTTWPLFLVAVSLILSTLTSISPLDSLWGSFFRGQGLYLALLQIGWAMLIVTYLRSPAQRRRLLLAIIIGGTLTAITAILEPFAYGENWLTWRPGGAQGNPIFLSGYLIMVLPFTLAALFQPWAGRKLARTILIGAAVLQLAALVLAQSRGPLLGAAVGGILFAGLLLWPRHRRLLIAGTAIGLIGLSVLAIGLNSPAGLAPSLSSLPVINRLNFVQDAQTGTGRVRLVLWQAVGRVVTTWPQVVPGGDVGHFLRPVLGYGLDTAAIVYMQVYLPELGHIEDPSSLWDRAHNESLDVLTMQGGLGMLAYVVLGLVCARRGFRQWRASESMMQRAWIAAPLAALAAHIVEVQFAFTLTTTGMLVWLGVALLLIRPQTIDDGLGVGERPSPSPDVRQRMTIFVPLVGAIILIGVALRVDVASIRANALAGEARALDQNRDWQQSIDRYDQAIALIPWQATYHQFRGEAFYNLARALPEDQSALRVKLLEAAERALATAQRWLPLDLEVNSNCGVLYAFWAGIDPAQLPQAEAYYQRAFALAPTAAVLRVDLGHVYHNRGRYADALAQYAAALQIDPKYSAAYFDSGLAYQALGQPVEAQQAFHKAQCAMPNSQCAIEH
jgi:hypothetical protein